MRTIGCEHKSDSHLDVECGDFERHFRFVLSGYNLRPLEMFVVLGQQQLLKLPMLIKERRKNAMIYKELFGGRDDLLTQQETAKAPGCGGAS